jgi:hypothetical protein
MERYSMIIRFFLMMMLVSVPVSISSSTKCDTGCKTTVAVRDCDDAPVVNAKVQIKICCNDDSDVESTTDHQGQVTFPYCVKSICGSKIVLGGFGVSSFDPNGCTNEGKTSHCTVKICKR